jgi:hypothetical protein
MESVTTALSGAKDLLLENYMLWAGLFAIILAFGVYVYLTPSSVDFFKNPKSMEQKHEPTQIPPPELEEDEERRE